LEPVWFEKPLLREPEGELWGGGVTSMESSEKKNHISVVFILNFIPSFTPYLHNADVRNLTFSQFLR